MSPLSCDREAPPHIPRPLRPSLHSAHSPLIHVLVFYFFCQGSDLRSPVSQWPRLFIVLLLLRGFPPPSHSLPLNPDFYFYSTVSCLYLFSKRPCPSTGFQCLTASFHSPSLSSASSTRPSICPFSPSVEKLLQQKCPPHAEPVKCHKLSRCFQPLKPSGSWIMTNSERADPLPNIPPQGCASTCSVCSKGTEG